MTIDEMKKEIYETRELLYKNKFYFPSHCEDDRIYSIALLDQDHVARVEPTFWHCQHYHFDIKIDENHKFLITFDDVILATYDSADEVKHVVKRMINAIYQCERRFIFPRFKYY